jgi:hypothetical protein
MKRSKSRKEPNESLFRIQRALAGYVSYLAACEANTTFSEYSLYEPILRVLMARGYFARCQSPCPGIPKPPRGDRKEVDFEARKGDQRFALTNDYKKLVAFHHDDKSSRCFLAVFGRLSDISRDIPMKDKFTERGDRVVADLHRTKYGCRIYELNVG